MIEEHDLYQTRMWAQAQATQRNPLGRVADTVLMLIDNYENHRISLSMALRVEGIERPDVVGIAIAELLRSLSPDSAEALAEEIVQKIQVKLHKSPDESP